MTCSCLTDGHLWTRYLSNNPARVIARSEQDSVGGAMKQPLRMPQKLCMSHTCKRRDCFVPRNDVVEKE